MPISLFTQGSLISFNAVLHEGPALIISPVIARYPFKPGCRAANVD